MEPVKTIMDKDPRIEPFDLAYIEKEINKTYLLVDKGIIRMIIATVIGNRMGLSDKPIWLLLLAGSSCGKGAILNIIDKCGPWIVPIDTLTTNTFASGLDRDEEVSLLWKANNGILLFKDFTTLTTMNDVAQAEIMGQMRMIYDGEFTKHTGNNVEVLWRGKLGIIAGGTVASQRKMRQYSEQGERFLNYVFEIADAQPLTKRALKIQKGLRARTDFLAEIVAQFVNEILESVDMSDLVISDEVEDSMIAVADFATMARSPVTMSKKDPTMVEFVGDREMPPRMAMMLVVIAQALMIISKEKELKGLNARIIYKIALDSIPVERRLVLRVLAEYRTASTQAIAYSLNYPTATIRAWCNQLNALKMINRENTGGASDMWTLRPEYKKVMCKYENITPDDSILEEGEGFEDSPDSQGYNAYVTDQDADDIASFNFDNYGVEPEKLQQSKDLGL